jgi:hypothetical protein
MSLHTVPEYRAVRLVPMGAGGANVGAAGANRGAPGGVSSSPSSTAGAQGDFLERRPEDW